MGGVFGGDFTRSLTRGLTALSPTLTVAQAEHRPSIATPNTVLPITNHESGPISNRDNAIKQDGLPSIGSFALIKDLVRDYTDLTIAQQKERKKLDLDSKRLYPSTKIAKDTFKASMNADFLDHGRKSHSVAQWGTE